MLLNTWDIHAPVGLDRKKTETFDPIVATSLGLDASGDHVEPELAQNREHGDPIVTVPVPTTK